MNNESESSSSKSRWYDGVTRYQWMVLAIASAGWVFDIFEGQIFGSCMNKALPELLAGTTLAKEFVINLGLGAFLLGGAVGGVGFGMLADRFGRRSIMAFTILMYSVFTGLTFFAQTWWQLVGLRFFVGMGVGGEWAVAAALVAEVFSQRARPIASGIFHASSVLGTYLAVLTGWLIVANFGWRYGFLVGVLPALMILWVRISMHEPESWKSAQEKAEKEGEKRLGRFRDLFSTPELRRNSLIGMGLGIIGLTTFWGCHFRAKDVLRKTKEDELVAKLQAKTPDATVTPKMLSTQDSDTVHNFDMIGMFLVTTGGGIGLLSFAPISQRMGRRRAFMFFHFAGFVSVAIFYFLSDSITAMLIAIPIFGFFTLAMHAGYAVYFPELFPTRLRGTGAGFCFNMARVVTIPFLLLLPFLQAKPISFSLATSMFVLSSLFLIGAWLSWLAPETRNQALPE